MRVAFCEIPCGLEPDTAAWTALSTSIADAGADLVVLNEMPFGPWLAARDRFDRRLAEEAVAVHEAGLSRFDSLGTPVVISSRPVPAGDRLANEAFAWVRGAYLQLHHKHYFPSEPGFYESAWFQPETPGFTARDVEGVRIGAQMCTEIMFNEWARHYGRQGAKIIAAPRASGISTSKWRLGLAMAAAVSGSYVFSSNRVGEDNGFTFGGRGFAYAPGGALIGETSPDHPIAVADIDLDAVALAQTEWPCYVEELGGSA
jgi:N-carbamoylputrescine amidase